VELACNKECNCNGLFVTPSTLVCSLQGTVATVFLSPCHAGCYQPPVGTTYSNCSCVVSTAEKTAASDRNIMWRDLTPYQLRAHLRQLSPLVGPAPANQASHGRCPQSSSCRLNSYLFMAIMVVGSALMVSGPQGQTKLLFLLRSVDKKWVSSCQFCGSGTFRSESDPDQAKEFEKSYPDPNKNRPYAQHCLLLLWLPVLLWKW
jgi:hypothetical protein